MQLPSALRAFAKRIWYLPERLLHPLRRRRATRSLRGREVGSVIFLCHGNVCRSPYAAASFARLLPPGDRRVVGSAGFVGPDRSPPSQALQASERRGLDLSQHRSVIVAKDAADAFELIVVMSSEQGLTIRRNFGVSASRLLVLGDLDPVTENRRTIADPWGRADRDFDESYERIDRCVRVLAQLTRARTT